MKYSVFTVCMPSYTVEDAAAALRKWKFDGVEWRFHKRPDSIAGGATNWGANLATVDERKWEDEVPEVRKLCKAQKLETPSLAAYVKCHDPKRYEPAIEAAAALGAPLVRIGIDTYDRTVGWKKLYRRSVRAYEKVIKYAARHKVKPVIECHMGLITPSASAAAQFCSNFGTKDLGIIYDPGNMVYEGFEDYQMGLEMLGGYLAHVHVKNAEWRVAGADRHGGVSWKPTFADMKAGFVDFENLIRALKAVGYEGWMSFEDFNTALKAEDKLPEDLKFLKKIERQVDRDREREQKKAGKK